MCREHFWVNNSPYSTNIWKEDELQKQIIIPIYGKIDHTNYDNRLSYSVKDTGWHSFIYLKIMYKLHNREPQ